jgi:hypothetical protein
MHPSVSALVEDWTQRTGIALSAEEIIRKRCQQTIEFGKQLGMTGPPYNPAVLASCLGIQIEPSEMDMDRDALLIPRSDGGLLLRFNPRRPQSRINFTLCHEIVHTFFPDAYTQIHARGPENTPCPVELLCDLGAAELLMPREDFLQLQSAHGSGLRSVAPLSRSFGASREPVIRRLAALATRPSAAIFLRLGLRKEEQNHPESASPRLRIHHFEAGSSFPSFIPINKSSPEDSCVYRALRDPIRGSIHTGTQEGWNLPRPMQMNVEAMNLQTAEDDPSPTVAALLLPA